MAYTTLIAELNNGIYTVTVNRPDKLNAINKDVMTELGAMMDEVEKNSDIKAVVITGSGPKAFVAGADISEFTGLSLSEGMDLARRGHVVFNKMENSIKPVIAAVNGFALGGGCELAMACHFRYASNNAKFGQPEVNLGLIPGYGGTQRLVQLIGKGRALELLLTGNMIDAETAERYGLVNKVLAPEELLPAVYKVVETIISKGPVAVGRCITAANAVFDETQNGFDVEIQSFGDCFDTADMKEGATAFLEKRKPVFTGK